MIGWVRLVPMSPHVTMCYWPYQPIDRYWSCDVFIGKQWSQTNWTINTHLWSNGAHIEAYMFAVWRALGKMQMPLYLEMDIQRTRPFQCMLVIDVKGLLVLSCNVTTAGRLQVIILTGLLWLVRRTSRGCVQIWSEQCRAGQVGSNKLASTPCTKMHVVWVPSRHSTLIVYQLVIYAIRYR